MTNDLVAYKKSLESAWGFNDYNDWPIKFNSIMHLFMKEFAEEFLLDLKKLEKQKNSIETMARIFGNPARIYRIINPIIYGMKGMGLSLEIQREVVRFLLQVVRTMKHGSPFNEDGKNIILNPQEVEGIIVANDFTLATPASAAFIHRFLGIMWAYTEVIFFRAHDVTKEIHGPYDLGLGQKLLIREYLHLNPVEIWPDQPLVPFEKLEVLTIYSDQLDLQIDAYNHLFHEGGHRVNDLISYRLMLDGAEMDFQELEKILPYLFQSIESIHQWAEGANWQTRANKYADIYWYRKRPLRDLFNMDWKVPKSVRQKITRGEINKRRLPNLTEKEIHRLIYTMI